MLDRDNVKLLQTECPPDQPGGLWTAIDNVLQWIVVGVDIYRSTDQICFELPKCENDGLSLTFDDRPVALGRS